MVGDKRDIKAGKEQDLYVLFCRACKIYKEITASAPCGPGGTISCPVCKSLKQHGPHFEGAYGRIVTTPFKVILPIDVDKIEEEKKEWEK